MESFAYLKPLPQSDPDSKSFWDGCKEHKLVVQKCNVCGASWFPPGPMCYKCQSMDISWVEIEGRGVIDSWVVARYSPHEEFRKEVPYAVVGVKLGGSGIRMCGDMVNCKIEDIHGGMPVEVVFEDVTDEVTLPRWQPVK